MAQYRTRTAAPRRQEPPVSWRTRWRQELRYGLIYLPICSAPFLFVLGSAQVDTGDNVHVFLSMMVGVSCLLTLGLTWQLYRKGLVGEAQRLALDKLVRVDSLTGLFNRRALWEAAQSEVVRSSRQKYPISACLIDLDNFKEVNDRYGHRMGDQLLRAFAQAAREVTRDGQDQLYRMGGDEFLILFPGAPEAGAEVVAQRLHQAFLDAVQLHVPGCQTGCSIGVAQLYLCETAESWIHRADAAMYTAKEQGGGVRVYLEAEVSEDLGRPLRARRARVSLL